MRNLLRSLAIVLVVGGLLVAESPAPASARTAAATGDLIVDGRGWGHRRGLGQYGALGYAIDHGWSTSQIVSHFYGGTSHGTVDPNQEITVHVRSHEGRPLLAQVDAGAIATFPPGGAPVTGSGRAVRIENVVGGFRVSDAPTCAGPWTVRPGTVAGSELRVRAADPGGTETFAYGDVGDVPVSGDWNGDGVDTPGVWRAGVFYLSNARGGGTADLVFRYGTASDQPVVGDWNGDGRDTVGIRRGNVLHLRNSNTGGGANLSFGYGVASDVLVVGDWDGNGTDTPGIRRGNAFYLRNANSTGPAHLSFGYGTASDVPIMGDWDGNGTDTAGVRRGTTWLLRDANSSGPATRSYDALGPGVPVKGRWTGKGADLVGRVDDRVWELALTSTGGGAPRLLQGSDHPLDRTVQLCHATPAGPWVAQTWGTGGWTSQPTSTRFYRGELRAVRLGDTADSIRTVNALGLDWYLRGVVPNESPASWGNISCADGTPSCGQRALEAQSIAARSYALGENRASWAKTCDTTACQVYPGRASRSSATASITVNEAPQASAAIASTPGHIRRMPSGTVARTEFSSSTGGWTAGGTFPSVVDDGDDTSRNPNHRWQQRLSPSAVSAKYGQGELLSAAVTARSSVDGRAVTQVRLEFSTGAVTRTGEQFRVDWGLKSSWFDLTLDGGAPAADRVGLRRGNAWYLRYDLSGGDADVSFGYGLASDVPVVGDWDGDRLDGPGVRRGTTWLLRNPMSSGDAQISFDFGLADATPLVGDWDGDGVDTVGVRSGQTFELRDTNTAGPSDHTYSFGWSTDVPVMGDWDGDGDDTPGIFRDGTFHLRNEHAGGAADRTVVTGLSGTPLVGDWDGNGVDDVGVRSGQRFLLHRSTDGALVADFAFGWASDLPLAGRWP